MSAAKTVSASRFVSVLSQLPAAKCCTCGLQGGAPTGASQPFGLVTSIPDLVALFSGDKKKIGDAWYGSVASRADPLIDQWKREREQEQ